MKHNIFLKWNNEITSNMPNTKVMVSFCPAMAIAGGVAQPLGGVPIISRMTGSKII